MNPAHALTTDWLSHLEQWCEYFGLYISTSEKYFYPLNGSNFSISILCDGAVYCHSCSNMERAGTSTGHDVSKY